MSQPRSYLFAKLVVLGVAVGLLAQGSPKVWPLEAWPMFHDSGSKPLPTEETRYEVRVLDHDRTALGSFRSTDLFGPESWSGEAERLLERAFEPGASDELRRYLVDRARDLLGDDVAVLEGWRLTWNVDAGAHPPLRPDQPDGEEFVASLDATDLAGSPS